MATSTVRNQRFEVGDLITYPRDTKRLDDLNCRYEMLVGR
jgi:hypothetical protein